LGLAIAKGIVEAHGGVVRLQPADHGTCVAVTLPVEPAEAVEADAAGGAVDLAGLGGLGRPAGDCQPGGSVGGRPAPVGSVGSVGSVGGRPAPVGPMPARLGRGWSAPGGPILDGSPPDGSAPDERPRPPEPAADGRSQPEW
jgi:hypothetical protein